MKKSIILASALLLGAATLGGVALSQQRSKVVKADNVSELQALLTTYNVSGYTKKTQMYLTPEAVSDLATYFHAGANTLKRATYYNAAESALLMGNYDGTFGGAGGINGGFRNLDENNCERFHYTDAEPNVANFFDAEHTARDYTAAGQTVGGYYQTLSSLSAAVAGTTWSKDGGAYIYNIEGLEVTDGEYNNPVLKKFQYFAAPMLKQNAYFSWSTIRVVEGDSYLSIRLYASKASATGKTDVIGNDEGLISEARVYKGISMTPEKVWSLASADVSGTLELCPDIYEPEQYKLVVNLAPNNQFKVTDGVRYYGYDNLSNKTWFNRWNGGTGDGNAMAKLAGEHTIYFKPHADNASKLYIAVPETITLFVEYSKSWNGTLYYYTWKGAGGDGNQNAAWPGEEVSDRVAEGNNNHNGVFRIVLSTSYENLKFNTRNYGNQTYESDTIAISNYYCNAAFYYSDGSINHAYSYAG